MSTLPLFLFLTGILGFVLNRRNIILMIISIEIMLLAVTLLVLISSYQFNDNTGQLFGVYIISIAGAESVIGLSILVAYYRLIFNIFLSKILLLYNEINIKLTYKYFNLIREYSKTTALKDKPVPLMENGTGSGNNSDLHPLFVSGLFDAESSFVVIFSKNTRYKTGWAINPRVQIKMHIRDKDLILSLQNFFGNIGYISYPISTMIEYRISNTKDLIAKVIPHFDNYPLKTKKYVDYILFKNIVTMLVKGEHKTIEGFKNIIAIKASLNKGLSNSLKEEFKSIVPYPTDNIKMLTTSIEPAWMSGFCTGEGNFFIGILESNTKLGKTIILRYSISQDSRDIVLLTKFIDFYGGGYVANYKNRNVSEFIITKKDILVNKVIPLFEEYPIKGSKYLNFKYFNAALTIIKRKEHLTEEGLSKIIKLKNCITLNIKNDG